MLYGDRLKSLRESRKYTHQELALLLEVGFAQIYRYEAGKNEPTADVLTRIAKLFDVSIDYLVGLTDAPLPPGFAISTLTEKEQGVLAALRRGENYEAIKLIVNDG